MKKILLSIAISCFFGQAFSQTNNKFEIKGITTAFYSNSSSKKLDKVAIKVYNHNDLIDTFYSNERGKFDFKIPKNAYITLEFVKDNFVAKRILFDTRTEQKSLNEKIKPFDLEIVLLEKMDGVDYSDLDFPITRIEYVKKMQDYYYATKYTERMLKVQENILLKMEDQLLSQK
ncbi:MAG: hypothetical protein ACPGSO_04865 [Vicingaceae bacterium]